MFKYLNRLQTPTILAECEKEVNGTAAADVYFRGERDTSRRAELLQKAAGAGLADHQTVKRLDFLQRLLADVCDDPTPSRLLKK